MIIQILLLLFIVYVMSRVTMKYASGDITVRELAVWVIFWLLVAGAIVWPQKTDVIAQYVGVSRGADLLVYVSIIALFFSVFRLTLRMKKIDQTFTSVVRSEALEKLDHER